MREILFRGKRKNNGEWIEGFYFRQPNPFSVDGSPIKHCISDLPPFGAEIVPETVGQYTGLTDKNGKRIFEGDIAILYGDGYGSHAWRGTVVFKDGCFGISHRFGYTSDTQETYFHELSKVSDKVRDMGASVDITYSYEVIGNIHDNPELLK